MTIIGLHVDGTPCAGPDRCAFWGEDAGHVAGITCSVLVDAALGNSSNGGLSSTVTRVTLVGQGVARIFRPTTDAPPVEIGEAGGRLHARPLQELWPADAVGPMFGGSFIYTSDSRFRDITRDGRPLHLHDRFETSEQYRLLSS